MIMVKFLTVMLLCLLVHNVTWAHASVWYDRSAGLSTFKKIVIFPLEIAPGWESHCANAYKDSEGNYNILYDLLSKKIKSTHFTPLLHTTNNVEILQDNSHLQSLIRDYSSEEERARAVEEATAADGYLVCRYREDRVQEDWSPEAYCPVTLRYYTREYNASPDGKTKTYNEGTFNVTHRVEGQYVYLQLLNLEYTLYDSKGNKVMLLNNSLRNYDQTQQAMFKGLADEFTKTLKNVQKDKGK